jgi:hypothetical protein
MLLKIKINFPKIHKKKCSDIYTEIKSYSITIIVFVWGRYVVISTKQKYIDWGCSPRSIYTSVGCFPVIINNLDKMYSNKKVKENRRDNEEWIIQRHVKHRAQDTERRQTKQKNTKQKKKKINWLIWGLDSYSYGVQRHFKQYFSYIVAISIIGGGHQIAWG